MKHTVTPYLLAVSLATSAVALAADPIDYPDGYRHWHHVKSMTIHEGHPLQDPFLGIHHVYANDQARAGLAAGRFDDGSILVFDLLQSDTAEHASTEGNRVLLGVMVKDSRHFARTNGWGYEGWAGDSRTERLVKDGGAGCHGCHTQQQDHDFVFSQWRE